MYENGVHSTDCVMSAGFVKLLRVNVTIGNKRPPEKVILHEQQAKLECGYKDWEQNQSMS